MAVIEIRELVKDFDHGRVRAIDRIDLATMQGEYLVLLGPSGCGKTTLLRTIAGLEQPTSGDVLIDERVVTQLPPRARKIAMVFQSYALYPHKTVFGNIVFPWLGRWSASRRSSSWMSHCPTSTPSCARAPATS